MENTQATAQKPPIEVVNYVDKLTLLKQIAEFQEAVKEADAAGKPRPRQPNTIGQAILNIVSGVASRGNFRYYTYIEEMCGDAIEDCTKAVLGYDVNHPKQNPFGYFSRCTWYAFITRITKEKKEQQIKLDSMFDPNQDSWTTIEGDRTNYDAASNRSELLDFYYGGKISD